MPDYQLTKSAAKDLEEILEYGIEEFGPLAAIEYYDTLVEQFDKISQSPRLYPSRNELGEGYRVCVFRSHDVYFAEQSSSLLIVRILNRQNIEDAIKVALEDS